MLAEYFARSGGFVLAEYFARSGGCMLAEYFARSGPFGQQITLPDSGAVC